jgi:hypothetical protein
MGETVSYRGKNVEIERNGSYIHLVDDFDVSVYVEQEPSSKNYVAYVKTLDVDERVREVVKGCLQRYLEDHHVKFQ